MLNVVLGIQSALSWTEVAFADDRVLRVQDGAKVEVYAVNEMIAALGLTELRLAKDPHFGANRVFAGFALEPLLEYVGLGDAPEVLLVCSDGYRIPFVTSTLPWPFQLTEIRRFDRDGDFTPARLPQRADDSLQKGFALYTDHCGKCHRMRGVGGEVGRALDRDGSLSSLLTEAQLRKYVHHDERSFPHSKMPQFSKILRPTEIDQVVDYLRAMQPLISDQ